MTHATGRMAAAFCIMIIGAAGAASGQAPAGAASQPAPPPTFTRDVAPVLFKHCTTCHRPGEIAPMSLLTYRDARPWARAIRDNVVNGTMPPWHADPAHGTWKNDRRLDAAEKDVITRWVAAGAPEGDAKDLPPAPVYADGWSIGQPDVVLSMETAYQVPAQGEIPYQYFEVPTNFTEDKWVQALEIRPGDRSVVHHVLVYARAPGTTARPVVFRPANPAGPAPPQRADQAGGQQPSAVRRGPLFAQTAPGTPPTLLEPGSAMLVRAGTVLTFQIHYTTAGREVSDRTSIGFRFARQAPVSEVRATAMMNPRFMIPARAANHPVASGMEFLEDVTIYGLVPHTHLRGKSWEYRLDYPDGRSEILLAVPKYDFNWQTEYVFATPLRVPKGSTLRAVAHYDNSPGNTANPDPSQDVYWGDQTWEEMQYTGINYSVDKERAGPTAPSPKR